MHAIPYVIVILVISITILEHAYSENAGTRYGSIDLPQKYYFPENNDAIEIHVEGKIRDNEGLYQTVTITVTSISVDYLRNFTTSSTDIGTFSETIYLTDVESGTYFVSAISEGKRLGQLEIIISRDRHTGNNDASLELQENLRELSKPGGVAPLTVTTDRRSYASGDVININGKTFPGEPVSIMITDPSNNVIFVSQTISQDNGEYSNSINTGGKLWFKTGNYTVTIGDSIRTTNTALLIREPAIQNPMPTSEKPPGSSSMINTTTQNPQTLPPARLSTNSNTIHTTPQSPSVPPMTPPMTPPASSSPNPRTNTISSPSVSNPPVQTPPSGDSLIIGVIFAALIIIIAVILIKRKKPQKGRQNRPSHLTKSTASMLFYECPKCHNPNINNNPDGSISCPRCNFKG